MSEIIFDSEVRGLAELNTESPFFGYVKSALLPNQGSGNDLTDLVSGVTAPLNGGTITWNSDGSISGGENTNYLRRATFNDDTFEMDLLRDEFVHILDVERLNASNGGGNRSVLFSTGFGTSTQNYLHIEEQAYSSGIKFSVLRSSSSKAEFINNAGTGRNVYVMHWRGGAGEWDLYENGALIHTELGGSLADNDSFTKSIGMGVGGTNSKQYSQAFLVKSNGQFTTDELESLMANPYQLFKRQIDVQQEFGLKLNTASHSISIPFVGAYDINLTDSADVVTNYTGSGTFTLTGATPVFIKLITGTHNTNVYEIFDFNQTDGDTTTSHTSALVCTLSGLPADSGYVRDDVTGQLVGYQFTVTTTATLVLTGAYTGTITYSDDTTLAISGSGNYVINTGIVKSVVATDTVTTFNWDGTTGDTDSLINTDSNNHATITNVSTDKWQPIVPVDVYTVGTDIVRDYADVTQFLATQNTLGVNNKALLYGECANGIGEYILPSNTQGTPSSNMLYTLQAGDNYFDGTNYTAQTHLDDLYLRVRHYTTVNLNGLYGRRLLLYPYSSTNCEYHVNSCAFSPKGMANSLFGSIGGSIKNSYLNGYRTTVAQNSTTTLLNNQLLNCSGYGGQGYAIYAGNTAVNNITYHNTDNTWGGNKRGFELGVLGSNNISDDPSATDSSVGTGSVDFTNAFVDEAQGDYRINQAWADTNLVGKGWNGSDITSWAYYVVVETGGTEQTIVISSTEQLTQSQLVNILGIGAINAIVSEQKSQSQLVSITEINQLNAITSEQKTQSTLIDISEINHVSAIVCEQLTQSVLVAVTANGAQSVSVIITEQKTQSELVSIDEIASVNVIVTEQLTQSNLVTVDESSGALISVVIAEQKTQSQLVSISAVANINPIICEQLTQSNIQQISVDITIDAIICEQLTQAQLITIVQSNIADALNIDIDQITIEMLTPKYTIELLTDDYNFELLTPIYTIENIH